MKYWSVTITAEHRIITLKKYAVWSWRRRARPIKRALSDHEWGIWWMCFGLIVGR